MPGSIYEKMAAATRRNVAVKFLSSAREKTLEELLSALPDKTIAMIGEKLKTISEVKKQEQIKALEKEIADREAQLKSLKK